MGLVTQLVGFSWKKKIHLLQAWEPRGVTQSKMLPSTGQSQEYTKCSSAWNQQSAQSLCHVWLCDPMNCSTPGFPVPTPAACLNSCPSSRWCNSTISSSVVLFSDCLQSFPEWGSFPRSQFFTSGGQSIGVSASASVHPMNIQDWFPLDSSDWLISLQSKGFSRVFFNTTVQKHQFSDA